MIGRCPVPQRIGWRELKAIWPLHGPLCLKALSMRTFVSMLSRLLKRPSRAFTSTTTDVSAYTHDLDELITERDAAYIWDILIDSNPVAASNNFKGLGDFA